MNTYIVQPGYVVTATGGQQIAAGGEIELETEAAQELGPAVALKESE